MISDLHGSLDARVPAAFDGVSRILCAGDICRDGLLFELGAIAPVVAVSGNCDAGRLVLETPPPVATLTVDGVTIVMVHDRHTLGTVPSGTDVVVFGHSHLPLVQHADGVLWLNPGSSTQPRRSPLGKSVALLDVRGPGEVHARLVPLSEIGEVAS